MVGHFVKVREEAILLGFGPLKVVVLLSDSVTDITVERIR